jgi:hypothetical protein
LLNLLPHIFLNSQFSILNSQFSILNSQFSILNSQFSILNSQFPILNSQFSILNSQFPIPNSQLLIPNYPHPFIIYSGYMRMILDAYFIINIFHYLLHTFCSGFFFAQHKNRRAAAADATT